MLYGFMLLRWGPLCIQWYYHIFSCARARVCLCGFVSAYIYIFKTFFRIAHLITFINSLKKYFKVKGYKEFQGISFYCEIYFRVDKGSTRAMSEINVGQCDRCRRHRTNETAILVTAKRDVFWPSAMEALLEGNEPKEYAQFIRVYFVTSFLYRPD